MEGITKSRVGLLSILLCLSGAATAQTVTQVLPGLPGKNVNIIGPTIANPALPNPIQERETVLRQQNEPSCTVRPENPAYIFCAYNDYRATDFPLVQGDSWMGVSWTADYGKTWYSRLAPGYKAHPNNVGFDFAADPNVVSAPGNSPGIVVLNYLAASRDLNDGTMAIQRWAAMEQEDVTYYAPENIIFEADRTNAGQFADKPALIAMVDLENKQSIQTIYMTLEDGTQVERNVPSATLVLCYSIFTGSNSSKVGCRASRNWGETWSKFIKISEEQTRVQGVSLTNIGNRLVASWRRADKNKGNSIVTAVSTNGAKTWTKGADATSLCPIDQLATGAQIRMLDFPWSGNDGERFYLLAADRRFAGIGTAEELCASGIPKIGVTWSDDGLSWSPLQALDVPVPGQAEPSGNGYQFIPTAASFRGNIQVAWYDTRRETFEHPGSQLPAELTSTREPVQMRDYVTSVGDILSRKADVYTLKIRGVDDSGQKLATPQFSQSIRVSQYRTLLSSPLDGEFLPIPVETEAHYPNAPIFVQGTRAFNGDYVAAAVAAFRKNIDGTKWIQNSFSTLSELTDREDVFLAWGDTRDLRGNYLHTFDSNPSPFTPNETAAGLIAEQRDEVRESTESLALDEEIDSDSVSASVLLAESEADAPAAFGACTPRAGEGEYTPADRTRDANVYGSMVRHVSTFTALTATKPLIGLQRTFPVIVTSHDDQKERRFKLQIAGQPDDFATSKGRASWKQLPNKLFDNFDPDQDPVREIELTVPPKSTAGRTLFLVTQDANTSIPVDLYELVCPASDPENLDCTSPQSFFLKRIIVGNGGLQESEFCQNNSGAPGCFENPVTDNETHNPLLLTNPDLLSPDLLSPDLVSPDLLSPDLVSPDLLSPDLLSLGFASPDLLSPDLLSPDLISPDLLSPDLLSPDLISPDLISPDLLSPDLISYSYQDQTFTLQNGGNVTTTYSADASFDGLDPIVVDVDGVPTTIAPAAQLIVWTTYVTASSRDCEFGGFGDHQILASTNLSDLEMQGLDLPTSDDPFAGPVSFAARPGQVVNVTLRVYAPKAAFDGLSNTDFSESIGFGASAHSCNDPNLLDQFTDCLTIDSEKIVIDGSGPVFDLQAGSVIPPIPPGPPFEADRVGGACIDLVGDGLVSATDDSSFNIECSLVSTGQQIQICSTTEESDGFVPIPIMSNRYDADTAALVSCTATDASSNFTTIELGIAVADTTPPSLTGGPGNPFIVEAGDSSGKATLDLENGFFADDVVDPSPIIFCMGDDGEETDDEVGPGIYNITCNASDESSNFSPEVSYELQVLDASPPTLSGVPNDMPNVQANAPGGATVSYTPSASDSVDGPITVSCSPASGFLFLLDIPTRVECSASDQAGNTASEEFYVTVHDTIAPELTVPAGVSVDATIAGGMVVTYAASTSDVTDSATLSCEPPSGSIFLVGDTMVTCTATDGSDNETENTFVVRVNDKVLPTLALPADMTISAGTLATGAVVTYSAIGSDTEGSAAAICTPASGSTFNYGSTTVSCTATDDAGNQATASFQVTVNDDVPPTVSASDVVVGLVDAHIDIDINYITGEVTDRLPDPDIILVPASGNVVASDVVDPNPALSCNTVNPLNFTGYATSIVSCTASDTSGNTSSATTFNIGVSFPYEIELILPKGQARAGSTIPIDFRYYLGNTVIDSSSLSPLIEWIGPYASNDSSCANGTSGTFSGQDSGSSSLRYSESSDTYQFSWQTPDISESAYFLLVISPPGTSSDNATECVSLR